jgi:hypothetical protein
LPELFDWPIRSRPNRAELFMPRKLVHIALAAASRQDLVGAWAGLGFALDAATGGGFALRDGVRVDFLATDDPARRAASVGLSAGPAEAPLAATGEAASCFHLFAAPPSSAATHPNGALGVRAVVAVAESPADHAEVLSALTGQREMLATSAGLEIRLDGGVRLDVLSAPAFAFRFGAAPAAEGFHVAGLVFAVKNPAETEAILRANGFAPRIQAGRLLAGTIEGVAIAFEQA